jgi:hypothetical protein
MAKKEEGQPAVCCPGCHRFFVPARDETTCTSCYQQGLGGEKSRPVPTVKPKGKK